MSKKEEVSNKDILERVKALLKKQQRKEIIRQEDEEDNRFRRKIVK